MKQFIVLFVITWINFGGCNKTSPEYQHDYNCKISIERAYQESCTIQMRPNKMGHAMIGLLKGNDEKAIEFCNLVPAGANCVLDTFSKKITDDCKSLVSYESKIVLAQHDKSYSEYYCANDMQNLRDRSYLDGMDCLYVPAFYDCKYVTYQTDRVFFTVKEELCRENYLFKMCSKQWGTCENQKVRDVEYGRFDIMHEAMECPPQE